MPLDWTISHDESLVTLRSEGALRYDEMERYLACVSAEGAMPYRKLFDARGGRSELNEQQMMSYAGNMSGYSQRDPLGPYAVVVDADRGRAHESLLRLLILTRSSGRSGCSWTPTKRATGSAGNRRRGRPTGSEDYVSMARRLRRELASTMAADEIKEADRLVEDWRPVVELTERN